MFYDDFSYDFYEHLIKTILLNGYRVCSYFDNTDDKKCILRHDIDFNIEKSLALAKLENKLGVKSTYFVLLKTDFYNPLSKKSISLLKEIISLGHDIGLHFDEKSYDADIDVVGKIQDEAKVLGDALEYEIRVVSMHRPSSKTLDANYVINGIINSYSDKFFKEYKYVSDSRRNWREDVLAVINSGMFNKLHILTHAFWYNDVSLGLKDSLKNFIVEAKLTRLNSLKENFTNLDEILDYEMECKNESRNTSN